jgi:NTE family protein
MHTVNLALQGGGSHGAFTWGVLDALLEDGRLDFEGLSGASAGAVNAVALASGCAGAQAAGRDPRDGARESLARLWSRIGGWGALGGWQQQLVRTFWLGLLSPYQTNPLDINPLRSLLEREVDFEAIARHPVLKVYVSATHVHTGKAVIFTGRQLDVNAVLASACLPTLFKAVEIDGQAYWDGGYSLNPPLSPLVNQCAAADLILVQINALTRQETPSSAADIADRVSELTFNASLLTQMRVIEFINRMAAAGGAEGAWRKVHMHRIDGGEAMAALPTSSRSSSDAALIERLFTTGRAAGQGWLARHHGALGRHGTVDIRQDYLDDSRLDLPAPVPASPPATPVRKRGFRPWLARLLSRSPR